MVAMLCLSVSTSILALATSLWYGKWPDLCTAPSTDDALRLIEHWNSSGCAYTANDEVDVLDLTGDVKLVMIKREVVDIEVHLHSAATILITNSLRRVPLVSESWVPLAACQPVPNVGRRQRREHPSGHTRKGRQAARGTRRLAAEVLGTHDRGRGGLREALRLHPLPSGEARLRDVPGRLAVVELPPLGSRGSRPRDLGLRRSPSGVVIRRHRTHRGRVADRAAGFNRPYVTT